MNSLTSKNRPKRSPMLILSISRNDRRHHRVKKFTVNLKHCSSLLMRTTTRRRYDSVRTKKIKNPLRRSRKGARKKACRDREKPGPKPQRSSMCQQVKSARIMTCPCVQQNGCLKESLSILLSQKTECEKQSQNMWEPRDTAPSVTDTIHRPGSGNTDQIKCMDINFNPRPFTNALLCA